MKLQRTIVALALLVASTAAFAADRWVITRRTTSGVCVIQLETSRPYLGEVIGTYETKPEASQALAEFKKSGRCE